jgi:hypothetical protein
LQFGGCGVLVFDVEGRIAFRCERLVRTPDHEPLTKVKMSASRGDGAVALSIPTARSNMPLQSRPRPSGLGPTDGHAQRPAPKTPRVNKVVIKID